MKKARIPDYEKKRKLMETNRASARRSALRKKLYIENLEQENTELKKDNEELKYKIERYQSLISEYLVKKAEIDNIGTSNSNDHSVIIKSSLNVESTMAHRL